MNRDNRAGEMSIIEIENEWGLVHRYEFATLPAKWRGPVVSSKT